MAKILITGGAGFIGSHLARKLLNDKHDVIVYDSFSQYIFPVDDNYVSNIKYRVNELLNGAKMMRGSTLNKDDLRRCINSEKPDYIVQFAALPLANLAIHQSEEAFDSILKGTVNLLEILRDVRFVKKVVYISSSMIYGDFEKIPQPEDGEKKPKEIYGSLKLAGEILVRSYSKRYDFNHIIIRPSAVYGPTDNNKRVLQIFVENAIRGEKITAKNAKSTYLDFSFVEDTAEGVKLAVLADEVINETFNITRGTGRSLSEALEIIKGYFPGMDVEEIDEETFHPHRGSLDVSKARKMLNYDPKVDLEEGLKRYIDFLSR